MIIRTRQPIGNDFNNVQSLDIRSYIFRINKLSLTNFPKFSPKSFFAFNEICMRNFQSQRMSKSAVTANQSAKAPTIPASENDSIYPSKREANPIVNKPSNHKSKPLRKQRSCNSFMFLKLDFFGLIFHLIIAIIN